VNPWWKRKNFRLPQKEIFRKKNVIKYLILYNYKFKNKIEKLAFNNNLKTKIIKIRKIFKFN
jgi:hypothetical protein